jgi:DNA polymerase-3 subunit epsilon
MGAGTRFAPCALAEMGRCLAPCEGRTDPERYGELVRSLLSSLTSPGGLLAALEARMHALAAEERFEEAASARERLRALAEALERARRDAWLLGARTLVLRDPDGRELRVRGGLLEAGLGPVPPRDRADEVAAVRSFLARHPPAVLAADPPLAEPVAGGAELARVLARLRAADPRSEGPGLARRASR